MFNFTEFKDCVKDPPTQDGDYLVFGVYKGEFGYAQSVGYTSEWGWNTSKNSHNSPIDFSDRDEGFVYYWSKVSVNG